MERAKTSDALSPTKNKGDEPKEQSPEPSPQSIANPTPMDHAKTPTIPGEGSSAAMKSQTPEDEEGMGVRSYTFSEGCAFPRRLDTYSGTDDHAFVPSGYRKQLIERPLQPTLQTIANMSFEEWLTVDRASLPGWNCSSRRLVTAEQCTSLVPRSSEGNDSSDWRSKVKLFNGPVTELALDCIVNAANEGCMGGGGVDGAIHATAGPLLKRECATFPGCETGQTRITKGYYLPARFVLHTVGPIGEKSKLLTSCYRTCYALAQRHGLRSIGFCCISTGIFGYPLMAATKIALEVTKEVMESDMGKPFDRIVFACFKAEEAAAYKKLAAASSL